MKVKIKLGEKGQMPIYQTKGSVGFDIHSTERTTILPGRIGLVQTALFVEIPEGYELQIRSRSGLAYKNGVFVLNSPGTIDSDYRGEIGIILANFSFNNHTIEIGERIAQGVIAKVEIAEFELSDELTKSERNDQGFGSTGN